ncbi:MAG: hypothetical protein A2020_16365 [Lentisphaerae bacterium GWF2_45_14]|nr:MAG: hypothetical protein A2020_16365 [Lentisphaerae bacterium GWF2_45_14]
MEACYVKRSEYEELKRLLYNIRIRGGEIRYSSSRFAPGARAPGITITIPTQRQAFASDTYDGPFAVKNTSEGETIQVTVNAGDIIAGTTKVSVPETDIAISSSCVVYIELSYSDSSYSTEIKTASLMPGLSSTVYRTRLADITFQDSRIKSVTQMWQYGDIYVAGRFV